MNKKFKLSLLIAILLIALPNVANAQKDITIVVNGKTIETDVAPYIENGRTMVPARFVTEALGGEISYYTAGEVYPIESVVVESPERELALALFPNHRRALESEGVYKSEVPPVVKDGRTMIPLRFIADYFGCKTTWDEKTWTVNIISGNNLELFYDNYWDDEGADKIGELLTKGDLSANSFSKVMK